MELQNAEKQQDNAVRPVDREVCLLIAGGLTVAANLLMLQRLAAPVQRSTREDETLDSETFPVIEPTNRNIYTYRRYTRASRGAASII
jgi:hypothetical protein